MDKKQIQEQQNYQSFAKKREPKRPVLKNCIKAFVVGGVFVLLANTSIYYIKYFGFTEKQQEILLQLH